MPGRNPHEHGHHEWYSGKHKTQGGNVQIVADPTGFPGVVRPGRTGQRHDITAARTHCRGALYAAAGRGLPTLADKGYACTRIGIHTPIKGRHLAVDDTSYNMLLTAVWALGERANAELKERWKCIRRIRLCPNAISDIVAAAIVLSTLQRGNY